MENIEYKNCSIAILGAGAVGGLLAALFCKRNIPCACIDLPDIAESINNEGLVLESERFGNFIARPRSVSVLDFEPDVIFITAKANILRAALGNLPENLSKNAIIVPLLNGLEHFDILKKNFGDRVVTAMIGGIESQKIGFNKIRSFDANVRIELASSGGNLAEKTADILKEAGIPAEILDNEADVIWRKLVRLNAIASTTAACQQPIGFVRTDKEWRECLEGCVFEGAKIARAQGANISPSEVLRQIDNLPETLLTSLQKDVGNRRPSEVENITGAVLRLGEKSGIPCPAIGKVYGLIKQREAAVLAANE